MEIEKRHFTPMSTYKTFQGTSTGLRSKTAESGSEESHVSTVVNGTKARIIIGQQSVQDQSRRADQEEQPYENIVLRPKDNRPPVAPKPARTASSSSAKHTSATSEDNAPTLPSIPQKRAAFNKSVSEDASKRELQRNKDSQRKVIQTSASAGCSIQFKPVELRRLYPCTILSVQLF